MINRHIAQCFGQWAGTVRESKRQLHDEAWARHQQALNEVIARLDPDGDGVVDKDEFTEWAKSQALQMEMWKSQMAKSLSELDERTEELNEQAAEHVDKDELASRLDRLERSFGESVESQVGQLAGIFDEFKAETVEERERRRQLQMEHLQAKIVIRMRNFFVSSCFGQWAASTAELSKQKAVVHRVMKRMINRHIAQCFGQWAGTVRIVKQKVRTQAQDVVVTQLKKYTEALSEMQKQHDALSVESVAHADTLTEMETFLHEKFAVFDAVLEKQEVVVQKAVDAHRREVVASDKKVSSKIDKVQRQLGVVEQVRLELKDCVTVASEDWQSLCSSVSENADALEILDINTSSEAKLKELIEEHQDRAVSFDRAVSKSEGELRQEFGQLSRRVAGIHDTVNHQVDSATESCRELVTKVSTVEPRHSVKDKPSFQKHKQFLALFSLLLQCCACLLRFAIRWIAALHHVTESLIPELRCSARILRTWCPCWTASALTKVVPRSRGCSTLTKPSGYWRQI